ncbi:MAG: sel1 repeat family protein [Desulfovibrio sp.]|nr:sel1 repeat family protein [Desulfovibrio sp.]
MNTEELTTSTQYFVATSGFCMMQRSVYTLIIALAIIALPSFAIAGIVDPEPTDELRKMASMFTVKENAAAARVLFRQAEGIPDTKPLEKGNQYARAIMMMKIASERGDALSQQTIGVLYEDGRAVPKDVVLAFKWLKMAADQGLPISQTLVAAKFEFGVGVRQDYAEAANWYLAAANQNYPAAQMRLGLLYEAGKGVARDIVVAYCWLLLGASAGDLAAQTERTRVERQLTRQQIAEAQEMARTWSRNHPTRCIDEGTCLPLEFK